MSELFRFQAGNAPLLVSMPHVGTEIPDDLRQTMTPVAAAVADTDWHVDRLYDFAREMDATVLSARYSRYCIDLNRHPEGQSLYPGASVTELCPTSTFDDEPLYIHGPPDQAEINRRRDTYWQPYHVKLRAELARLRQKHKRVLLWEGHSIRSVVPRFFEGRLPDLNFGTGGGKTADPELIGRIMEIAKASPFSSILNGRFTGGYITRTYGKPAEGVHAIQLEKAQIAYMDEAPPFRWDPARAADLRGYLKQFLAAGLAWVES
jgi:N-formylglutamate deformylase